MYSVHPPEAAQQFVAAKSTPQAFPEVAWKSVDVPVPAGRLANT
jgi:secreted protein with Ig-like and vWFA domain